MCQPTGGVRRARFNAASSVELLMSKWQTHNSGPSLGVVFHFQKATQTIVRKYFATQ